MSDDNSKRLLIEIAKKSRCAIQEVIADAQGGCPEVITDVRMILVASVREGSDRLALHLFKSLLEYTENIAFATVDNVDNLYERRA